MGKCKCKDCKGGARIYIVDIELKNNKYPIYITTGYDEFVHKLLNASVGRKLVIVTDENVYTYQFSEFCNALKLGDFEFLLFTIVAGERSKRIDVVCDIYRFLIRNNIDKETIMIAFGGGVVGDITGFVAATFHGGIDFIQVPTTLLAQVDSSVGGKVGINLNNIKNIIGSFYQPKMVFVNVDSLTTLPDRQIKSGLAEVIVHSIIRDAQLIEFVECNIDKIFGFDKDILMKIVETNCQIKGSIVQQDEKETGIRAILNFGHTIGHAIEGVYDFSLLHGECISIGMIGAMKIALYKDMIDEKVVEKVKELLTEIGLPISLKNLDEDLVYNQMIYDKKIKYGSLNFILPIRIGSVIICNNIDSGLVKRVLRELNI